MCPVTGKPLNITADTAFVGLVNGQKLYFSDDASATAYKMNPRDFWLGPHDQKTILPDPDGKRGLPDLRTKILHCPRTNETLNITMGTPRVLHKWGQVT
jgi:hypothetical protein